MVAGSAEAPPSAWPHAASPMRAKSDGSTHLPHWMGIELVPVSPGVTEGLLRAKPEVMNIRGHFHGGAVSTLADVSMISAVNAAVEEGVTPVTVSLHVTYLRPGSGWLHSRARVTRIGGGMGFASVLVADASGKEIATGDGVFRLLGADARRRAADK